MITYNTIKTLAKDGGLTVADLCALAPKNDPFYTGRPAEKTAAEWFTNLWKQFGYRSGVHLRRVHYQIVSQNPPVNRPDGTPYQNTETCWDFLNEAAKWARYLRLVKPEAFVDRRNPDAVINAFYPSPEDFGYDDPTPGFKIIEWDNDYYNLPDLPQLDRLPHYLPELPDFEAEGYTGVQQAYHIEIWCEKTTMNDVLKPLCQRYNVNLVTGAGELSITAVVDFMRRARNANRPARILYISDFDPAGLGMPISVARKIEYFQRNDGFGDIDIRLHPIVLDADQVAQFKLPRVPVKDTDLRKDNFERAYGEGQVELDALEALYPGQLAKIVREAIFQYYDTTLNERAREQLQELKEYLSDHRSGILEDFSEDMDSLERDYSSLVADFEVTIEEFEALVSDFQPKIDAYKSWMAKINKRISAVYGDIQEKMQATEIDFGDQFPLPEPELPEEEEMLYDSRRDYIEQLQSYKNRRSNNGH